MNVKEIICIGAFSGLAIGVLSTPSQAAVIAYYSFDKSTDLGHDDSGNGLNLSATVAGNSPASTSGAAVGGGAVLFDGTNDIFTRTGSDIYTSTPNFSISFWVKPTTVVSGVNISRVANAGVEAVNIYTSGATPTYRISVGASGTIDSGVTEVAGTYVFQTITFQASGPAVNGIYPGTDRYYINGVSVGTPRSDAGYTPAASTFGLGGRGNGSSFFGGTVDEFAVYNQVLTQPQITALYNKSATPLTVVPEPAMLGIVAFGGMLTLARRRRQQR